MTTTSTFTTYRRALVRMAAGGNEDAAARLSELDDLASGAREASPVSIPVVRCGRAGVGGARCRKRVAREGASCDRHDESAPSVPVVMAVPVRDPIPRAAAAARDRALGVGVVVPLRVGAPVWVTYALTWGRFVKVGRSVNAAARCQSIVDGRAGVTMPAGLDDRSAASFVVVAAWDLERELHRTLAGHRVEGEWFLDSLDFRRDMARAIEVLR